MGVFDLKICSESRSHVRTIAKDCTCVPKAVKNAIVHVLFSSADSLGRLWKGEVCVEELGHFGFLSRPQQQQQPSLPFTLFSSIYLVERGLELWRGALDSSP